MPLSLTHLRVPSVTHVAPPVAALFATIRAQPVSYHYINVSGTDNAVTVQVSIRSKRINASSWIQPDVIKVHSTITGGRASPVAKADIDIRDTAEVDTAKIAQFNIPLMPFRFVEVAWVVVIYNRRIIIRAFESNIHLLGTAISRYAIEIKRQCFNTGCCPIIDVYREVIRPGCIGR